MKLWIIKLIGNPNYYSSCELPTCNSSGLSQAQSRLGWSSNIIKLITTFMCSLTVIKARRFCCLCSQDTRLVFRPLTVAVGEWVGDVARHNYLTPCGLIWDIHLMCVGKLDGDGTLKLTDGLVPLPSSTSNYKIIWNWQYDIGHYQISK